MMRDAKSSLDMTTLVELRGLLEDELNELLADYLEHTPLQLNKLNDAIKDGDIDVVASICHTLKGSSGNLGVQAIYVLCQDLEQEAARGELVDGMASFLAIEQAYVVARDELTTFMSG